MALIFPLAIAFLAATLYAAALSTTWGVRLTLWKTHFTVVAGTLLTLGCVALVDMQAALISLLFFIVTGLPMMIRSEWREIAQRHRIEKSARGEQ